MNPDEYELSSLLPSRRTADLERALGRRLEEVERLFNITREGFAGDGGRDARDYFSRNVGPTQLRFAGGPTHALASWPEQLSVVLLEEPLAGDDFDVLYALSADADAPPALRAALGQECADVRIWTFRDEVETDEAKEAGVSYLLADGTELLYCAYLHGDLSADYLITPDALPPGTVASCWSVRERRALPARRGAVS